MERVLSDEEKLRKAIEISQRRDNYYKEANKEREKELNNPKEYRLFKKMIIQIFICLFIYGGLYLISNEKYIFSKSIINKTSSILNYDVNLNEWIEKGKNSISIFFNKWKEQHSDLNNIDITVENNSIQQETENQVNMEEQDNSEQTKEEQNTKKPLSQMEKDINLIKRKYNFKRPLKGKITSRFGEREVLIKGMTANHKGLDIAAKKGTKIKAVLDGQVEEASKNSKYGNYIKIKTDDIETVYAHCQKLKVKNGKKVKKGDVIATVGSTGIATGPHLHFEIKLSNRYIDPELIIQF